MKPTWMNSADHATSTSVILWSLPQAKGHHHSIAALLLSCFVLLIALTAQADEENHNHAAHHPSGTSHSAMMGMHEASSTEKYQCPMHPEITSHQPDDCPICGMHLMPVSDADESSKQDATYNHDSHNHAPRQTVYVCPMHPDETAMAPGRCSICGMFLVPQTAQDTPMNSPAGMTESMNHHAESAYSMADSADKKPTPFWESTAPSPDMSQKQMHSPAPLSESHRPIAQEKPAHEHSSMPEKELPAISEDTTYICPMHPQIVSDDPDASCPICGMDLVAKQRASAEQKNPQVYLNNRVMQNMGVRTHTAKRSSLAKSIKTQGIVKADDERILYIHPRTGGWIERLYHISEGDRVERKEELLDFYSPWINQAQLDLITALEELDMVSYEPMRKGELEAKVDKLRNTLRLLNVSPMDVMRIEKSRKVLNTVQIMAPQGGLITELNVSEGSYVEPYESMFTIVDLSEIWVMVDIFEHQASWVRKGQEVTITTAAIPGREWRGHLEFIYPEVNPKTRTLRARIEVPNPDEALLLNMFVQVDLSTAASKENVITLPREAIMQTGEREIVVKSKGQGHFQPVEVKTGLWGDQQVEILAGVADGEEIVVSGQFLIDSESNIQSSLLRMSE